MIISVCCIISQAGGCMEFFCNYIWEKGLREKNEDSLCIRQVNRDGTKYLLAVVCDGIGGLEEGENASSFVVNGMLECFKKLLKNKGNLPDRRIRNAIKKQIYKCHKILQRYGKERGIRLGTTMSMILIAGRRGYIFHVGDSAIFAGKKRLKRLSPIHQNRKGALLQAVGTGKNPLLFYKRIRLRRGMVLLLASDGFYRKSEHHICTADWIKRIECDEHRIRELLVAVKENVQASGERDNISAVCIKMGGRK